MRTLGLALAPFLVLSAHAWSADDATHPVGPIGVKVTSVAQADTTITGQTIRFP